MSVHSAQVKLELPVHIHEKHHILFVFYHISCESSSKASNKGVETLGEETCDHMIVACIQHYSL